MSDHHNIHKLIPEFDGSNLTTWTISIEEIAFQEDLSFFFQADPPTPDADPARKRHLQQNSKARMLIITSLSKDVIARLSPPVLRSTPYQLYTHIQHLYANDPMNSPDILREKARHLQFGPTMTMQKYLEEHVALRNTMLQQHFPGIEQESVTIDYIIDGLRHHPELNSLKQHMQQPSKKHST